MRKLIAADLGLRFLAAASSSATNAQSVPYSGSPGSPYMTGSLKRHKAATTHQACKVRVRGHKVKRLRNDNDPDPSAANASGAPAGGPNQ